MEYTTYYNLPKPEKGMLGWDDEINDNLEFIDNRMKFLDTSIHEITSQHEKIGAVVGNASDVTNNLANHSDLQTAVNALASTGGEIKVIRDVTTTGISIPDNTTNLTIFSTKFNKIIKSGTNPNSKAFYYGQNCSRIMIRGFEFEGWDDTGDYLFYAAATGVDVIWAVENYSALFNNANNFSGVVSKYVYDHNL